MENILNDLLTRQSYSNRHNLGLDVLETYVELLYKKYDEYKILQNNKNCLNYKIKQAEFYYNILKQVDEIEFKLRYNQR